MDDNKDKNEKRPSHAARRRVIQAWTSVPLATYVIAHLATHVSAHFGRDVNMSVFHAVRPFYNGKAAVEAALLGCMAAHAACAVDEAVRRSSREWVSLLTYSSLASVLHKLSGWFLLCVMPVHVAATRVLASRAGVSAIEYATFPLAFFPELFVPYYTALSVCGVLHLSTGWVKTNRILKWDTHAKDSGLGFWGPVAAACALAVSSVAAYSGAYFAVPHPQATVILEHMRHHYPAPVFNFLLKRWAAKGNAGLA